MIDKKIKRIFSTFAKNKRSDLPEHKIADLERRVRWLEYVNRSTLNRLAVAEHKLEGLRRHKNEDV